MNLAGARLLLLEDEVIIAFALEDMLAAEGARPTLATTLEEADAALEHEVFDGAILDVNVNGEKSYGIARELKEGGVPLVFATGYGDAAHPVGFESVPTVMKPYNLDQLKQAFASFD